MVYKDFNLLYNKKLLAHIYASSNFTVYNISKVMVLQNLDHHD